MKRQKHLILVIMALIATLLLAAGPVAAKATVTEFEGTETLVDVPNPGTWTFPGGNIHCRGRVSQWYDDTDDWRITGMTTVVVNANWDANGVGPIWGTYHTDVGPGQFWDGTWTGMIHADGSVSVRAVGHGGGEFEGLKASFTIEYPPPGNVGTMSGRILDPHGE